MAGAGVATSANGFCVTGEGMDFFGDIDMVERVLLSVEFLREPFLKKFKEGILLFCEDRFDDVTEAG